ncbi:ATP-dependent DNA ligase [Amycolatopsis sp. K13G38]|uniref:ATP-dependent DNA ligase n=1 Tax=Amycolatopsis acididurans TaxID=2724524 RepID=A0ABX1JER3_9PSEU|nr:ATP-dependent DNA ligase [Amycolatopsis acididurans]
MRTSKPDKVFYPGDGVTKGDVVEHYRRVAPVMVPHLRGRPLTLRRFPDGISGEGWFQKEASDYFPDWLRIERIPQRAGGNVRHVVCDDEATLVYLANQATIEFHVWLSTVDDLERPDLMVLDLDPPEGTGVAELRKVARRARETVEDLGLSAFVQATGGRGFHIVTPLDRSADYETVRALARGVADVLAQRDPRRLTTEQRKDKRGDRIFLDTNRNGYAQTFVAPYSLRARPGAPVATPLDWSELGRAVPNGFDPARIDRRLARKSDPWQDLHAAAGSAEKALRQLGGA